MTDLPKHLSFSSRNTLLTCPKRYYLGKIAYAPETSSYALAGGSAVHTVTELIDRKLVADGIDLSNLRLDGEASEGEAPSGWPVDADLPGMPGDTAESVFTDTFADAVAEQVERSGDNLKPTGRGSAAWPNGRDDAWWLTFGPLMVAAYLDWRISSAWDLAVTPAGEVAIEVEVGAVLGYPTKGYIDRVFVLPTGDLGVYDLKTGSRMPPPLQLAEYATQLEVLFGLRPKWGGFISFPVKGESVSVKVSEPIDLSLWNRPFFEHLNRSAIHIITEGDFPPVVADHCGWCGQRQNCAAQGGINADTYDPLFKLMQGEAS